MIISYEKKTLGLIAHNQSSTGDFKPIRLRLRSRGTKSFEGWQVENLGGYYSESNGVIDLKTPGGNDPTITLYREIHPTGDFTFSLQVKVEVNEGCCIGVRRNMPINMREQGPWPDRGFNFEYGHYGSPQFLFTRYVNDHWKQPKLDFLLQASGSQ